VELTLFYSKFIELTDRVLPALHYPSDQLVYLQFFSRTIAIDERTCRISYKDLSDLTGLSIVTIKTATRRLVDHGILRIAGEAAAKVAKTYEVLWPSDIKNIATKLQRNPAVLLKDSGAVGTSYESILDKLTPDDRELLEVLEGSLLLDEEKNLRRMVRETLKEGENPATKFRELIVLTRFGPDRLKKYENA
jgi:DNA-binding Lrp family transcriptional regulator